MYRGNLTMLSEYAAPLLRGEQPVSRSRSPTINVDTLKMNAHCHSRRQLFDPASAVGIAGLPYRVPGKPGPKARRYGTRNTRAMGTDPQAPNTFLPPSSRHRA